jgi:hypothetical protein
VVPSVLAHAKGEWIVSNWPEIPSPHRMGTARTYMRRRAAIENIIDRDPMVSRRTWTGMAADLLRAAVDLAIMAPMAECRLAGKPSRACEGPPSTRPGMGPTEADDADDMGAPRSVRGSFGRRRAMVVIIWPNASF